MRDTAFWVPNDKVGRLPPACTPTDRGLELEADGQDRAAFSRPAGFESGAGGLVATVDDFHAFASMLLHGGAAGSTRILKPSTVESMTTDQLSAEQKARSPWLPGWWDSRSWGSGLGVVTAPFEAGSAPGQYGWDGGFGTSWRSDPREDLIAILMGQVGMTNPEGPGFFRDFRTLAFAAIDG